MESNPIFKCMNCKTWKYHEPIIVKEDYYEWHFCCMECLKKWLIKLL